MTWLWITTLGMPGMIPWTMSSRLGFVADVMATESPSHDRPVVIQSTCAVTCSVAFRFGANSMLDMPGSLARLTDARQRIADQLVDHPLAAERGLHQHHPGRRGLDLADLDGALAPRHGAQRGQGGSTARRLHERDECAL